MKKKDECAISRDLAIKYIEKSINDGSREFIDNHLKDCEDCRKFYKTMEAKICNENEQDKIMRKQFKKINNHINILKISLISVFIILLVAISILWLKQEKFSNIVNEVSKKTEYLETLDNYKITVKTIDKNLKTERTWENEDIYYYKDGKLKIESANSISFYEDDSYDTISVYHNLKRIEYHHTNYIRKRKGDAIGALSFVKNNYAKAASTIYSLAYSVRTDRYNGVECYVIRFGNDDNYRDVWIDKNNYITIREVNENVSSFYSETVFTFEENVVKDADVNTDILNSEVYDSYERISNDIELPAEEIELYDLLHKE